MREADNPTTFMYRMSWKSGSQNLLEPSGPQGASYGTALPLPFTTVYYCVNLNTDDVLWATTVRPPLGLITCKIEYSKYVAVHTSDIVFSS